MIITYGQFLSLNQFDWVMVRKLYTFLEPLTIGKMSTNFNLPIVSIS